MKKLALAIIALLVVTPCYATSIERAKLFNDHALYAEAKRECIQIITSDEPDTAKASAYYLLGLIAFDQNRIETALETWTDLARKYPESREASEVTERIDQLAQIIGETQRESIDSAIARAYLRHGDFWSERKDSIFPIDSSWIPKVEAAVKWYDKTIMEFPGTSAARIAYEEKMRTLLGWKDPGRYGDSHGIEKDPVTFLPILVQTFEEYATAFPESGSLQAFRYQIAQAYWSLKNWESTRKWLREIIEKAGEQDSFYADLAKRRLRKVEYRVDEQVGG